MGKLTKSANVYSTRNSELETHTIKSAANEGSHTRVASSQLVLLTSRTYVVHTYSSLATVFAFVLAISILQPLENMASNGSESSQLAFPVEPLSVQPSPSVSSLQDIPDAQPFSDRDDIGFPREEDLISNLGSLDEAPVSPRMTPGRGSPTASPAPSPIVSHAASPNDKVQPQPASHQENGGASMQSTPLDGDSAESVQPCQHQLIKQAEPSLVLPPLVASSHPSPSPSPSPKSSPRSEPSSTAPVPSDDLIALFEREMQSQIVASQQAGHGKPADKPQSSEQAALLENINFIKSAITNGVKATLTLRFTVTGGVGLGSRAKNLGWPSPKASAEPRGCDPQISC